MGYDEVTAERVRRTLLGRSDVIEKRMVGGLSFMLNGSMCCGVTSTGLMVRVGSEAMARVLTHKHVRPMKLGGRPLAGFVAVDPAGYRTDAALAKWVQRGLDVVSTLPAKPVPKATERTGTDKSEQLFRKIARRYLVDQDVNEGTGFGTNPGLRVGSKIFAMLGNGELVVKLPKRRVDELVASGTGARFDPRRDGRLMKEWATIPVQHARQWGRLADEALRFVGNR